MRMMTKAALVGGMVAMMLAPACGSDDSSTTSSTTSSSSAGGAGGASSSSAGGAGGGTTSACTEVASLKDFQRGQSAFIGELDPNFNGADPDYLLMYVPEGASGKTALTEKTSLVDCGDTALCALVVEDATDMDQGAIYVASGGDATIDAYDGGYLIEGSLANVTLVEATVDDMTGDVTKVNNGKCVHIASVAFEVKPPVDGWTCNPSFYDETGAGAEAVYCDCECGAPDPDCAKPDNEVFGCLEGQTCGAQTAKCEGVPTKWTCAPEKYNGGAGNGCDCGCGLPDPDCDLMPAEMVAGCDQGEVCGKGTCVPEAWTCDPTYFDETGAGAMNTYCDCGCGVKDPDCSDATLAVCDFCDNNGSCSSMGCMDNMDIKPDDNAVCK